MMIENVHLILGSGIFAPEGEKGMILERSSAVVVIFQRFVFLAECAEINVDFFGDQVLAKIFRFGYQPEQFLERCRNLETVCRFPITNYPFL
jgi:hypothetical protein